MWKRLVYSPNTYISGNECDSLDSPQYVHLWEMKVSLSQYNYFHNTYICGNGKDVGVMVSFYVIMERFDLVKKRRVFVVKTQ